MDIKLQQLRAFAAVAETRSFTAASQQLLVSQPALTRTVQQLERVLEVTLLERTSRSVELTDAGRAFHVRVQALLRDLDLAVAEVRGEREVRIGFSWALPDPWAGQVVVAFEEATGTTGRLVRRDDLAAALQRGEVDVALARHPVEGADVRSVTLFTEPRVAAVSSRSPLAQRESLTWDELGRHPVVVNTVSGNTRRELWEPQHRPGQVVECDTYDEWITLVAADRGVGATPLSASATHAHAGVVFVALTDAPPVPLYLVWLPRRAGGLVRRFLETAMAQPQPSQALPRGATAAVRD